MNQATQAFSNRIGGRMNGRLFRLCRKELRETLRDRRTIITLLLMPLLVYPILSMALNRFLLGAGSGPGGEPVFQVGVGTDAEADFLLTVLKDPRSQPPPALVEASNQKVAKFNVSIPNDGARIEDLVLNQLVDIGVTIRFFTMADSESNPQVSITGLAGDINAQSANRILIERLNYFNQQTVTGALKNLGIPDPPQIEIETSSIGEQKEQSLLATIIPLVLVLMTITGAVYPAIDLTAGERERGTMEALIASPIARSTVLLAKYVAVVTVAFLTAIANFVAMFVTLWAAGLLPLLVGEGQGIPWLQFGQIFALLVLFSGFFSAVLLALTSFARSFKEAQAYLIPVMLLSLAPGVFSLLPGVSLTPTLAIVPLLNIILLSREILSGTYLLFPTIVAIVSTVAYAAAAIAIAAKLFGSDAVLRGSEVSFTAALKRPENSRPRPEISEVAMTLALLFPVYFLVSNILSRTAPDAIGQRLAYGAIALTLVFGGLPLLAVWYCRDRPETTYRLVRPKVLAVLGAAIVGLGVWTWAFELFVFAEMLGIGGVDQSQTDRFKDLLEQMKDVSPALLLLTAALVPAVVEEFCFRGYLFSALLGRVSAGNTIVITAVLFGLFHVLTGNTLLIERFLPTTLLGLLLGGVAYHTGSVWPGVVLHLTHNAFLTMVSNYRVQLEGYGIGASEQTHLPMLWFAIGTAVAITGGLMIWFGGQRREVDTSSIQTGNIGC